MPIVHQLRLSEWIMRMVREQGEARVSGGEWEKWYPSVFPGSHTIDRAWQFAAEHRLDLSVEHHPYVIVFRARNPCH